MDAGVGAGSAAVSRIFRALLSTQGAAISTGGHQTWHKAHVAWVRPGSLDTNPKAELWSAGSWGSLPGGMSRVRQEEELSLALASAKGCPSLVFGAALGHESHCTAGAKSGPAFDLPPAVTGVGCPLRWGVK